MTFKGQKVYAVIKKGFKASMVCNNYIQLSVGILRHKNIRQAELKPKHTLLECYQQFSEGYIDRHRLIYIGHGWKSDPHIVERLMRCAYDQCKNQSRSC